MKEILFKGFHPDENGAEKVFVNGEWISGEWVQGYYSALKAPSTGEIKHVIFSFDRAADYVIPETVGEYTGLTDKNDKLIFEGDICRAKDTIHNGAVQIKGAVFKVMQKKGCWIICHNEEWDFLYTNAKDIEVIGNIHENPELL